MIRKWIFNAVFVNVYTYLLDSSWKRNRKLTLIYVGAGRRTRVRSTKILYRMEWNEYHVRLLSVHSSSPSVCEIFQPSRWNGLLFDLRLIWAFTFQWYSRCIKCALKGMRHTKWLSLQLKNIGEFWKLNTKMVCIQWNNSPPR